jgi:hypothetical protein
MEKAVFMGDLLTASSRAEQGASTQPSGVSPEQLRAREVRRDRAFTGVPIPAVRPKLFRMKGRLFPRTKERVFDALWRLADRLGSLVLFRIWKMPPHRNVRTPVTIRRFRATNVELREHEEHADERAIRRTAEAERGGMSSKDSEARYARGENVGGTHRKAVRHEGPPRPRPADDEPQSRSARVPRGQDHLPESRRGSN